MSLTIDLSAIPPARRIVPWPAPILESIPVGDVAFPRWAGSAKCPLCDFQQMVVDGSPLPMSHYCLGLNDVYLVGWQPDGTAVAINITQRPVAVAAELSESLAPDQGEEEL